jgi:hypothetical protein
MKRFIFWGLILLLVLLAWVDSAEMQSPPANPAIISFTTDIQSISIQDAETGGITATFQWKAVHLRPTDRIVLESCCIKEWLMEDYGQLPLLTASDTLSLVVRHPPSFAPPTYRLVIYDEADRMVDQYVLTIPYQIDPNAEAHIVSFRSTRETINPAQIQDERAIVPVAWAVIERTPTSNLIFEQVLPNDEVISVERPRFNVWVPSVGEGSVLVYVDSRVPTITLRLSVIDLATDTLLDQAEFTMDVEQPLAAAQ